MTRGGSQRHRKKKILDTEDSGSTLLRYVGNYVYPSQYSTESFYQRRFENINLTVHQGLASRHGIILYRTVTGYR